MSRLLTARRSSIANTGFKKSPSQSVLNADKTHAAASPGLLTVPTSPATSMPSTMGGKVHEKQANILLLKLENKVLSFLSQFQRVLTDYREAAV